MPLDLPKAFESPEFPGLRKTLQNSGKLMPAAFQVDFMQTQEMC
jgi:hypothetical protein